MTGMLSDRPAHLVLASTVSKFKRLYDRLRGSIKGPHQTCESLLLLKGNFQAVFDIITFTIVAFQEIPE